MSAKRKANAKPRTTAAGRTKRSPNSRSIAGRTGRTGNWGRRFGILAAVVASLAILGLITWFATASLRVDAAIKLDNEVREAVGRNDFNFAFNRARFAYALAPRNDRALTLGSLAYLRKDYRVSIKYFGSVGGADGTEQTQGQVGQAAAAARRGDQSIFRRAFDQAGNPSQSDLRLALAHAAIDAGDFERAGRLLEREKPENLNVGYAKSLAKAEGNPVEASAVLAEAPDEFAKPADPNPSYEKFLRDETFVLTDSRRMLGETYARMSQTETDASRQVFLANTLYGLEEFRAAERFANTAARSQPAYRDAWNTLASAQISLRDLKGARRSLRTSVDLDPSYGFTWYLRGELAKLESDDQKANEYRTRAKFLGYEK